MSERSNKLRMGSEAGHAKGDTTTIVNVTQPAAPGSKEGASLNHTCAHDGIFVHVDRRMLNKDGELDNCTWHPDSPGNWSDLSNEE